jgi:hypothetical protein
MPSRALSRARTFLYRRFRDRYLLQTIRGTRLTAIASRHLEPPGPLFHANLERLDDALSRLPRVLSWTDFLPLTHSSLLAAGSGRAGAQYPRVQTGSDLGTICTLQTKRHITL